MTVAVRKPIFDAVRATVPDVWNTPLNVQAMDNLLDAFGVPREPAASPDWQQNRISERIQLEILEHEGIVPEAYKDSAGVWTWGAGVTDASGHKVGRYRDTPTTILRCLEVYEWLLRTTYLPDMIEAFDGISLSEAQLGGALSFHWNTGAIGTADWVADFRAGRMDAARAAFMNYSRPKEIISRRKAEQRLFFDGVWASDGIVTVYERVNRRTYAPVWGSARQVDIRPMLREVVARVEMERAGQ